MNLLNEPILNDLNDFHGYIIYIIKNDIDIIYTYKYIVIHYYDIYIYVVLFGNLLSFFLCLFNNISL
jgi:hypothetical protein